MTSFLFNLKYIYGKKGEQRYLKIKKRSLLFPHTGVEFQTDNSKQTETQHQQTRSTWGKGQRSNRQWHNIKSGSEGRGQVEKSGLQTIKLMGSGQIHKLRIFKLTQARGHSRSQIQDSIKVWVIQINLRKKIRLYS